MTKDDFVSEIVGYYGDFQNDTVAKRFMLMLNKINDSDLDRLLDWFIETIPAKWDIDVTKLMQGVNACCIFFQEPKKICPIPRCRAVNKSSAKRCCNCGYEFGTSVEEYNKIFVDSAKVTAVMSGFFMKMLEKKKQQEKELENGRTK